MLFISVIRLCAALKKSVLMADAMRQIPSCGLRELAAAPGCSPLVCGCVQIQQGVCQ